MESIKESLEAQLTEVELLRSMFPSEKEFMIDDISCLEEVERFISGKREALPREISFTIQIYQSGNQKGPTICCSLSHKYPMVLPTVFVRCSQLSREQQKMFNADLQKHMESLCRGELCLSVVIMWVQEQWLNYFNSKAELDVSVEGDIQTTLMSGKFSGLSRLWIYSHHIYRKELLKKISEFAEELDITGFVLPGKPGIMCIEGFKENCDEYWQRLKYPNWKHISCKHRDDRELSAKSSPDAQLQEFRLFCQFEELSFDAHGDYGLRNDYHMNLGQFRCYLEQHKCEYVFQIFFGLDGKH